MTTANLVEIYCIFDEFCKIFNPELKSICFYFSILARWVSAPVYRT